MLLSGFPVHWIDAFLGICEIVVGRWFGLLGASLHRRNASQEGATTVMISPRVQIGFVLTFAVAFALRTAAPTFAVSAPSRVIARELGSVSIAHNKVGTDVVRKMLVYLPAGYDESSSQHTSDLFFP